jgi:hypothetical protein
VQLVRSDQSGDCSRDKQNHQGKPARHEMRQAQDSLAVPSRRISSSMNVGEG